MRLDHWIRTDKSALRKFSGFRIWPVDGNGAIRAAHGSFGFELRNAMVAGVDLMMTTGYTGDGVTALEERMIGAVKTIPGIEQAALVDNPPLVAGGGWTMNVFKDETRELSPSNVASTTFQYMISPDYFRAAGTVLLSGRSFTLQDHKTRPWWQSSTRSLRGDFSDLNRAHLADISRLRMERAAR